jgi:hypothetical protein
LRAAVVACRRAMQQVGWWLGGVVVSGGRVWRGETEDSLAVSGGRDLTSY